MCEPISSNATLWKGNWVSKNYPFVTGTIEVVLQNDKTIPCYQTMSMITYTGLFRNGERFKLPLTICSEQPGGWVVGGTGTYPQGSTELKYSFKGYIGNQQIHYQVNTFTDTTIEAIYQSSNPMDQGTLQLAPTAERYINYGETGKPLSG